MQHLRRFDDALGHFALLHPRLQRAADIVFWIVTQSRRYICLAECVRFLAALTVPHAGHHEQPEECLRALCAAHARKHALVVVDAGLRRDQIIGPAEIHQQLPAALFEPCQVGVGGVEHLAQRLMADAPLLRELDIVPVVELAQRPGRIVVHHVAEELLGERELLADVSAGLHCESRELSGPVESGRTGEDAVPLIRETLCRHQRLPAAVGTTGEISKARRLAVVLAHERRGEIGRAHV